MEHTYSHKRKEIKQNVKISKSYIPSITIRITYLTDTCCFINARDIRQLYSILKRDFCCSFRAHTMQQQQQQDEKKRVCVMCKCKAMRMCNTFNSLSLPCQIVWYICQYESWPAAMNQHQQLDRTADLRWTIISNIYIKCLYKVIGANVRARSEYYTKKHNIRNILTQIQQFNATVWLFYTRMKDEKNTQKRKITNERKMNEKQKQIKLSSTSGSALKRTNVYQVCEKYTTKCA